MPRDGSATRSRILATALRMFVEQGYDKTSLREVADEVGVTKAALYYHFKTKDDIARAALAEFGTGFDDVARWLEAQPPGPERDEGFVDRLLRLSPGEVVIRAAVVHRHRVTEQERDRDQAERSPDHHDQHRSSAVGVEAPVHDCGAVVDHGTRISIGAGAV